MNKVIVKQGNREVWCYGELKEDSNFSVECTDEMDSGIVADYNGPLDWNSVVEKLSNSFPYVEQIEAV